MKRLLIALGAAALLCACSPRLVILHTNDTHSHLDADRDGKGGAIERAAFVDSVRAACGQANVLLLHAGDFNQGTSYYSELGGSLEVSVVNGLRYDCITLGNHEFDNGLPDLAARVKLINCPVVCCNLDFRDSELASLVKPYAILRKAGHKIGIIGVTAELATCVGSAVREKITQLDAVECVNKCAAKLRNEEKCDLVLLLSHQGFEEDTQNAARISGVDAVVGGHSHTFLKAIKYVTDPTGYSVPIVTDGEWGLEMGQLNITWK